MIHHHFYMASAPRCSPVSQSPSMHAHFQTHCHFTMAGNTLLNSTKTNSDLIRNEVIHPYEFVLVYQVEEISDAQWARVIDMLQNRLSVHGREFDVLEFQKKQNLRRVAIVHKEAYRIVQTMAYDGVVCEFKLPQVFEFGFAPVLTKYPDLLAALNSLEYVMKTAY